MSAIPQEFSDLIERATAAMRGGNLPNAILRWEMAWDGDGLTPVRRDELHVALSDLCRQPEGGLLFVLLPVADCDGGRFEKQLVAAVQSFAGKTCHAVAKAETIEGWAHAFDLGHVVKVVPSVPELGETRCPSHDLDTEPFQRAMDGTPSAPHEYGAVLLTERDHRMIAMNAAVRDGIRVVGTVAGVLAFHSQPSDHIAGARVVVDPFTGAGFWGALSPLAAATASWAAQFGFPPHAVAELVRNAWVHRDWSKAAREQPIRVTINGRRLDVVSPGGILARGDRRNPVLFSLCRSAGLVHGLGTGLEDLADDLSEQGKCTVEVAEIGGDVRARLTLARPEATRAPSAPKAERKVMDIQRRRPVVADRPPVAPHLGREPAPVRTTVATTVVAKASPQQVSAAVALAPASTAAAARPTPQVHAAGSARDEQLVAFIARHGEVSCRVVQDDLGWTRSTTRDVLARLVALGRLRRTSEDPRSPTQGYVLA